MRLFLDVRSTGTVKEIYHDLHGKVLSSDQRVDLSILRWRSCLVKLSVEADSTQPTARKIRIPVLPQYTLAPLKSCQDASRGHQPKLRILSLILRMTGHCTYNILDEPTMFGFFLSHASVCFPIVYCVCSFPFRHLPQR
jgi:hypothetical protein